MMKKICLILFGLMIFQSMVSAKDALMFNMPDEGWHKADCTGNSKTKKCFVPVNQNASNYTEMLSFDERVTKNTGITASVILQKQLGKDRNNYPDIRPQYIVRDANNTIVAWCSELRNTCSVERAFQGKEGIVSVIYLNKAPHYSQNMFGKWANILGAVEVYDKTSAQKPDNIIELD